MTEGVVCNIVCTLLADTPLSWDVPPSSPHSLSAWQTENGDMIAFFIILNVNHFDRNPQINEKTAKDHNKVFAQNNPILRFTQILFIASPHDRWPTQDKTTSSLCSTMVPPSLVQSCSKSVQLFKRNYGGAIFLFTNIMFSMFVHHRSNDVTNAL